MLGRSGGWESADLQKRRRKTEKRNSMGKRSAGEITGRRNGMEEGCVGRHRGRIAEVGRDWWVERS